MELPKHEAEEEAIRRWYLLPPAQRASIDDAEAYSYRLDLELDFPAVTGKRRLIGAWLIREFHRARDQEAANLAALRVAQEADNLAEDIAAAMHEAPEKAA